MQLSAIPSILYARLRKKFQSSRCLLNSFARYDHRTMCTQHLGIVWLFLKKRIDDRAG